MSIGAASATTVNGQRAALQLPTQKVSGETRATWGAYLVPPKSQV